MKIGAVSLLSASLLLGTVSHALAKPKRGADSAQAARAPKSEEVNKLKSGFKWGMSSQDVMAIARAGVEDNYEKRLKAASYDPSKQARIRRELREELERLEKSYVKFEGEKSGLDVSIIGNEFGHNAGESVLSTKEDNWTRYFFFFEDRLYKMFIAFNKEVLQGKTFQDFGAMMQAKYGPAQSVFREEKVKGGSNKILDYYAWSAHQGDSLRLVDRSQFYDVYCLVVYDTATANRVAERRKAVEPRKRTDNALVEAVVTDEPVQTPDVNEDVVDRITGRTSARKKAASTTSSTASASSLPSEPAPAAAAPAPSTRKAPAPVKKEPLPEDLGGLEL